MSAWDGIDLGLDSGEFITLRDVGDVAAGTLRGIKMHDFGDGQGPKPQLTLADDEGNERILTAGPFQLRQILGEHKDEIEIGCKLRIELIRLEPRALGKAKIFKLDIQKATAGAAAATSDGPPF